MVMAPVVARLGFSWGQRINPLIRGIRDLRSHGYAQSEISPWFKDRDRGKDTAADLLQTGLEKR